MTKMLGLHAYHVSISTCISVSSLSRLAEIVSNNNIANGSCTCSLCTCVVVFKVAMMEICDWLEVRTSLKVVWSSVMVECGAQSVVISGEHLMPVWPAVSWVSQLQVEHQLFSTIVLYYCNKYFIILLV